MPNMKRTLAQDTQWYSRNAELVAKADGLIRTAVASRKQAAEPTAVLAPVCNEILQNVLKGAAAEDGIAGENSSVLLLGEAGSGKSRVVDWCIQQYRESQGARVVVMRAYGGTYATDVECIRHLASQAGDSLATAPRANASFEEGMAWIRGVLRESLRNATSVVIVLDKFEHFCSRSRQTLLYNLFDIAQDVGVRLSIIGTSEKMDVMNALEKRIKSRFSMRHLHCFLPTTMEDLVQALMARLRLPGDCGLNTMFLQEFHKKLLEALWSQRQRWSPHLELGRPPTWFLWKCLPVTSLLQEADRLLCCETPEKRPRASAADSSSISMLSLPSSTTQEYRLALLDGLSETEHIVMLALYRLAERQATRTLSSVLHEIRLLHEGSATLTASFVEDRYCAAFDRLLKLRLVECGSGGSSDVSQRYRSCRSLADQTYGAFVRELGAVDACASASARNPLRALPLPMQQWAAPQRGQQARLG